MRSKNVYVIYSCFFFSRCPYFGVLEYKGPPDPLRGDEIYRRVRDAAKESLDAIFDAQMPVTTSSVANRIQGTLTFY
jgi:hypothetical protein